MCMHYALSVIAKVSIFTNWIVTMREKQGKEHEKFKDVFWKAYR